MKSYYVILVILFLRICFANIRFYKYGKKFYDKPKSFFDAISRGKWTLPTYDYWNDFKNIDDEEFRVLWNKVKNAILIFFIVLMSDPVISLCIAIMSSHD